MVSHFKKNKPLIVYIGPFSFPNGGAAARRILGNMLSLQMAGYDVWVGTGQMPVQDNSICSEYAGFPVYSLSERTAEQYPKIIKHLAYLGMGKKTVMWLNSLAQKPVAVILYSGYSPYFQRLLPWCKQQNIPLIFDAVEWYDPKHKLQGLLSPYYWNIELAMRYYCVKAKNIIAISSYLDTYYKQRHGHTIRIPPTLDVDAIAANVEGSDHSVMTIGYTGTPGHKDLFDNYLDAFLQLDPDGKQIRLKVAGVTINQLMSYPAIKKRHYDTVPPCIETLGIVSHTAATELIRQVDFSVLLRPPARYAMAGFPTKVVESLAVGTPVITNLTSDLGNYIHSEVEGIICNGYSTESLILALKKALTLLPEQRKMMRIAARKQAEKSFDCGVYSRDLHNFIEQARKQ